MGWDNLNWYEICDEVSALKSFLVLDNEEAVGITVATGTYSHQRKEDGTRVGFVPDKERRYSLEELSGGELIRLGILTFSALVEDRLYYTDMYGTVRYEGDNFTTMGDCISSGVYECTRVTIDFSKPLELLPEEEIIGRKTILVRDNRRIKALYIYRGYMGIGGSNTSGFSSGAPDIYPLDTLDGSLPIYVLGDKICAVVGDVAYLVRTVNGKPEMYTLSYRETSLTLRGEGVAYDTISAAMIVLSRQ